MEERETRNITTQSNHVVVLKTYLTGREVNDIKRTLFGSVSVERGEDGKPVVPEYPPRWRLTERKNFSNTR